MTDNKEAWVAALLNSPNPEQTTAATPMVPRHVDDPGLAHPDNSDSPAWAQPAALPASPLRVTGANNLVEEAACLIWDELCPGMVMGDDDIPHYENAAKAVLALPASPLRGREIELRAALERSIIAIDDWLQTYAAELCDPSRVEEASQRIAEYGTLSYIAHVQQQNRAALSAAPPEQPDGKTKP